MGRVSKFLSTLIVAIFPSILSAQNVSDLPLSMGKPVEPESRAPLNHTLPDRPNLTFGDLSKPKVELTTKKPVFEFIRASTGQDWFRFTACSQDGGDFTIDMALKAEVSSIEHQMNRLGLNGYDQRVLSIKNNAVLAFQTVASHTHGQDLLNLFTKKEHRQNAIKFMENVAAVHEHNMRHATEGDLMPGIVHPDFRLVRPPIPPGPRSGCWKPDI